MRKLLTGLVILIFATSISLAETTNKNRSPKQVLTEVGETNPGILSLDEQQKALENTYKGTLFNMFGFTSSYAISQIEVESLGVEDEGNANVFTAGVGFNLTAFFVSQGLKYSSDSAKEKVDYKKTVEANNLFNILEKRRNYTGSIFVLKHVNILLDKIILKINNSNIDINKKKDAITRLTILKGDNNVKANKLQQTIIDLQDAYYNLVQREVDDDFPFDLDNAGWEDFVKSIMNDQFDSDEYWNNLKVSIDKFFPLPASPEEAYNIAVTKGSAIRISNLDILVAKKDILAKSINKFLPTTSLNYTSTDTEMTGQDLANNTVMLSLTWQFGGGDYYHYKSSRNNLRAKKYAKKEALIKIKSGFRKIHRQANTLHEQFVNAIESFSQSIIRFREIVKEDNFSYSNLDNTINYTSAFVNSYLLTYQTVVGLIEIKTNAHLVMGTYWEEIDKIDEFYRL